MSRVEGHEFDSCQRFLVEPIAQNLPNTISDNSYEFLSSQKKKRDELIRKNSLLINELLTPPSKNICPVVV